MKQLERLIESEMDIVKSAFPDANVFRVSAQYEYFHAIIDGVRMIFYPHKTKGTGNISTRVRNGTTKRQDDFLVFAAILQHGQTPQCRFHVKNTCLWNTDRLRAKSKKYENYWIAADEKIKARNK